MDINVDVDTRAAIAQLQRAGRNIEGALIAGVEDGQSLIHRDTATYPAQRRGSAYVRTDTLKGSWFKEQITVTGDVVRGRVVSNGNAASYNVHVQRQATQARVHRGLWTNTDENVARRSEGPINAMFRARITAVLGGG